MEFLENCGLTKQKWKGSAIMINVIYLKEGCFEALEHHPVMLSGCFAAEGSAALHKTKGIMGKERDVDILNRHLKMSGKKFKLGCNWILNYNDPKHTLKLVTN